MPGAAIGALLGLAFSGSLVAAGITAGWLGSMLLGASIGSLFDQPDVPDLSGSTPNYAFGPVTNTKSQLLPVPIVYGRCRMAGNVFFQKFFDDSMQKMNMYVGVSEGPISKVVSIYANDIELTDETGAWIGGKDPDDPESTELEDCSLNVHLGTPDQLPDSRNGEGDSTSYANTAYIAITLKAQGTLSGSPTITSIVEGRKVWTPAGERFTRNPAWIVWDLLTNTRYGVGLPASHLSLESFTAAAAYCDELVDGEPRFTLDYIIDSQRPAIDVLRDMLSCCRGYILAREKAELHIDRPVASAYKVLTPDNFVEGTFSWWQKSASDTTNRIVIEWVDPSGHYERSSAPFDWAEDIQRRGIIERKFSLLGLTDAAQVGRMGAYLLETARGVVDFCSFSVGLQDADIEAGDVIAISYPDFTGWDQKWFRVLSAKDRGSDDTVEIACAEYSSNVYSDAGLPVPTPNPGTPPRNYDDVYSLTLTDVGDLGADGAWVPVVRAEWQNPGTFQPKSTNIYRRYSDDPAGQWTLQMNTTKTITQCDIPGLVSGKDVTVRVCVVRPNTEQETAGASASMTVGRDVAPPGAPSSLTATGWFGSVWLEWINPTDKDFKHVEVWECSTDNRAGAVKIAETSGTSYTRYLGSFQGRYYWIRAVDLSGNVGQWNAFAGVYGYSEQETHDDFIKELLQRNPYLQEAIQDLQTPIGALEDLTIEIKEVTIPDIRADVVRIDEIELPQIRDVEIPRLDTAIELSTNIGIDAGDSARSAAEIASEALMRMQLELTHTGDVLHGAGFNVNPETGEVLISAVEAVKTELGAQVTDLSLSLDAAKGQIEQRATYSEVDERIAGAVFGDVGELLLSGVDARISEVSQLLDAKAALIESKAAQTEVSANGARITAAEESIDGLNAAVALRATKAELEGAEARISAAELEIDAVAGSITQQVADVRLGFDNAEEAAEAIIQGLLIGEVDHENTQADIALAKNELHAKIIDETTAIASSMELLGVKIDDTSAAIRTEREARVSGDEATASSIQTMAARVANAEAAIQTETRIRATADSSAAAQITTLQTSVGANASAIQNEVTARTDADSAMAGQITSLRADVGGNTAAIENEVIARTSADSAMAGQITTLRADVDGNSAAIQTEADARATADEAMASRTETIIAQALEADSDDSDAMIRNMINGETTRQADQAALAIAINSIDAKVIEGQEAAASATFAMAARMGEAEAAIREESEVRATESEALARQSSVLAARLGDAEGSILEEKTVRARADELQVSSVSDLSGRMGRAEGTITEHNNIVLNLDEIIASRAEVVMARFDDDPSIEATIQGFVTGREQAQQQQADIAIVTNNVDAKIVENQEAVATEFNIMGARMGDAEAAIQEEAIVRATQHEAMVSKTETMRAQIGANEAAIQEESLARSTADEALAQKTTTLAAITLGDGEGSDIEEVSTLPVDSPVGAIPEGKVVYSTILKKYYIWELYSPGPGGYWREVEGVAGHSFSKSIAAVKTEEEARTTAISAEALQRQTLEAVVIGAGTNVTEVSTLPASGTTGQIVFHTGVKKYYIWKWSDVYGRELWVEINGVVGHSDSTNRAAIQQEVSARTTADSAIAGSVQTLQTTVNGHTSSISTINQSVDGIKSKHAVKISTGGYVTGYELIGTGTTGSMVFHVDNFLVGKPGTTSNYPFVIGTVGGVAKVSMSNAFIQDAAIVSAKIKDVAVGTLHIQDYAVTNTHYAERRPAQWETPEDSSWSVNLVTRAVNVKSADTVMVHAGGVFQFNSGSYDYHGGFVLRLYAGASGDNLIAEADYYKFVQKVGGTGGMPFLIAGMAQRGSGTIYLRLNAYCWGYNMNPPRVTKGSFDKCWMIAHQTRK